MERSLSLRKCRLLLFLLIGSWALFASRVARAQEAVTGEVVETEESAETAERIRVLEAQKIRQDERASMFGGTGLVFTRNAILLPRKHFNVSTYASFSKYTYIQGWRPVYKLDDPRAGDLDIYLVADYGLTHYAELSLYTDIFPLSERNDPDQLHMRAAGLGQTGINAKFRLMDIDKDGLGIATTIFLKAPSPMQSAELTSSEPNYGLELNVSLKLMVITEWLEKFTVHANIGYGHLDYFDTGLAGEYQFVRDNNLLADFSTRTGKYRGDYKFTDLFNPAWGPDDYRMKHLWMALDQYTGSFAVEYKPAVGYSMGFELVGYRNIRFSDDNLQLDPFFTYTFRQIPFVKKLRKDILTATVAGQWGGLRANNRSSPQWGVVLGLTYHTDLLF